MSIGHPNAQKPNKTATAQGIPTDRTSYVHKIGSRNLVPSHLREVRINPAPHTHR
jgi:hypothetical protein